MDSESTAKVLDMPHVAAAKAEKAAKKAKRDEEAAEVTERPEVVFGTVVEAATEVVKSYEAAQRAREARTEVGKRFADQVKTANERLASAITDEPDTDAAKLLTSLDNAKARVKKIKAECEEVLAEDDGAVGKAWRKRAKVLEERAEAKAAKAALVEKRAARFEAVMSSVKIQAAQLNLAL